MKAALVAPFDGGHFTQNYIDALVRNLHAKFRRSRCFCKCGSNIHRMYCPLAPVIYCERRWPGCDGYISLEEYRVFSSLDNVFMNLSVEYVGDILELTLNDLMYTREPTNVVRTMRVLRMT